MSSRDGSSGWSDLLSEDEPPAPSSGSSTPGSPRGRRRPKPADSAPAKAAPPAQAGLSLPSPNVRPVAKGSTRPAAGRGLSLPPPVGSTKPKTGSDILGSGLQEHLSGSTTAADPGAGASGPTLWSEYREVILSIAGGVVLLGLAIWYTQSRQPEPVIFEGSNKAAVPATPAPPKPQPAKAPAPEAAGAAAAVAAPTKTKTRTPMLSIVSTPPDALVEIDGVVYGKTPLIMPSPSTSVLHITLKANGHRKWSKNVMPTEAGHFAVNAKLELQ